MKVKFGMMAIAIFMIAYIAHGQNITFPHDGLDRQYLIHIPEELPESPALVFVLHGYSMDNSQMMSYFGWTELADDPIVTVPPDFNPSPAVIVTVLDPSAA